MKTRPLVSIIIDDGKGKVLLQLRDSNPTLFPHCWSTFGGEVEKGETPLQAAKREIKEELNHNLINPEYVTTYSFEGYPIYSFRKIDTTLQIEDITLLEGEKAAFLTLKELEGKQFAFQLDILIKDYFVRFYPKK